MKVVAIILSGGRGSRMKSDIPKQYMELLGEPLIYYPLKIFQESFVDEIVLVCNEDSYEFCASLVSENEFYKVTQIVTGGKERYNSVYNGLCAIDDADYVFIHDGARAFVDEKVLNTCLKDVKEHDACVSAVPVKDTIKISTTGFIEESPNRNTLFSVHTPQCFKYSEIKEAYSKLILQEKELLDAGVNITDDTFVYSYFTGKSVFLSEGSYENIKVTTPEDLTMGELLLKKRMASMDDN